MKINKNSWHYWLLDKCDCVVPNETLCPYFWKVVAALLILLVFAAPVFAMVYYLFGLTMSEAQQFLTAFGAIAWAGGLLMATAVGIAMSILYAKDTWGWFEGSDKPDNLLISYVKTKKAKICPILEFEDV